MQGFFKSDDRKAFEWSHLGDVKLGREYLGEEMPVIVYRLMQFTLMDIMRTELDDETTDDYFRRAGHLAGTEFSKNVLKLDQPFDAFVSHLQEILRILKIGILRVESSCTETGELILTVSEDLDCSGLPVTGENVCVYDEGFIAGILDSFTGKRYNVREVDCWASGDRVCRFSAKPN